MHQQMQQAIAKLISIGGEQVLDFNFSVFAETAALLYGAPFVAERYAGIASFLEAPHGGGSKGSIVDIVPDTRLLPVIRAIISHTGRYTAPDVFAGMAKLAELQVNVCVNIGCVWVAILGSQQHNLCMQSSHPVHQSRRRLLVRN